MACFSPLPAYRGPVNEAGNRPAVWRLAESEGEKMPIPCGKCIGCRLKYAKDWAVRCMHEAQMHRENCFVTLTYDNDSLPDGNNLSVRDLQLFMKKLRKWKEKDSPDRVKFFFAGEYGGKTNRPHYHGLLFGVDFADKVFQVERFGNRVYGSQTLSDLWSAGFCSIGDVTFASASYVARYCVKKVDGKHEYKDEKGVKYFVTDDGELRLPEFTLMSRGGRERSGGIGASWFKKYGSDVYPSDEVIVNGRPVRPPRYYDNLLDKVDGFMLDSIKAERVKSVNRCDNDSVRLQVKEAVAKRGLELLVRPLEV